MFTPDLAFESIVKEQIERFKPPAVNCVDMVINELNLVVKKCTEKMAKYPALRDEVDKICMNHIRQSEYKAKEQIKLYLDIELSYINTQHPDFIGFAEAQNRAAGGQPAARKRVGNQIIRKGWLVLGGGGFMKGSREYWFTLSSEFLSWFKDESERELKYQLRLEGCKVKDIDSGFMSKRVYFGIFNPDMRNLFKDYKQLELSAETDEVVNSWKASLLRAGVYPERDVSEDTGPVGELGSLDPMVERQIETIRNLVDSYLRIISKNIQDNVPKTCMFMIIHSAKEFVASELLAHLYSQGNTNDLMHESEEEVARRTEMLRIYQASKEALKIIGDINSNTMSAPLPPPVEDYEIDTSVRPASSRPPPPSASRPNMPNRPNVAAPATGARPPVDNPSIPKRPAPTRPAPSLPARPPPVPSRP